jgi:hypothetical protein
MLYVITTPEIYKKITIRGIFLQIVFAFCLYAVLPIKIAGAEVYPLHQSIYESFAIESAILKNYHGGQVGYYLNRRFDEPFPNYEISYMKPDWNFIMDQTEYIVVPNAGLPDQVLNFTECRYVFYKQVGSQSIYQVNCTKR